MPSFANQTSLTTVVNVRSQPFDVYIGRPMPGHEDLGFGNPFRVGPDGSREEVIEMFRAWAVTQPALLGRLQLLKGKRLGCWCKPKACHGDVYLELLGEASAPAAKVDQLELF